MSSQSFAASRWQNDISTLLDSIFKSNLISLSGLSLKTDEFSWQTSCAIRRETESCAKINLGVMRTALREGRLATAAAVTMKGGGEQFNGREAETATLLWTASVTFGVVAGGFRPRHLNR